MNDEPPDHGYHRRPRQDFLARELERLIRLPDEDAALAKRRRESLSHANALHLSRDTRSIAERLGYEVGDEDGET